MSFEQKPVTLEEYNQMLRDSVNAYYVHACNDPSMSREEVIRTTSEMAERYLTAVEEFQEKQGVGVGQVEMTETEPSITEMQEDTALKDENLDSSMEEAETLETDSMETESGVSVDSDDVSLDGDGVDP